MHVSLTRIVYILLLNHTLAVNPTLVKMRNCIILLFMHVKILQKKTLLKKCGPKMWLCLFMFRLNTQKQLNRLTLIDMFSCGTAVTHQTVVREVPCSIPVSGKHFYILVLL